MRKVIAAVAFVTVAVASKLSAQAARPATAAAAVKRTQTGNVNVVRLASLDNPWGMAFLPDGRLLITEKAGRLRIYDRGRLSAPVEGVPAVAFKGQGGLLDVAVDPGFAHNRLVYISYAELAEPQPADARETGDPRFATFIDMTDSQLKGGAVARARLDGSALRDLQVIWRQTPKTVGRGHFGGRLLFAADGTLLITSGDRMRFDPAQDMSSNIGKMVRINTDGSIPPDNPFVNRPGALGDIWSVGHRNALGMAINPATKGLWIHEMGPAGGDEVNVIMAGRNYGWHIVSNGDNYDGSHVPDHLTRKDFEAPVQAWTPSVSPSGLLFHSGRSFVRWRGNALMGGLSSKALIRLTLDGNRVTAVESIDMGKRIRDVIEAPDGAVLLLVDGSAGELLRLTPQVRPPR